MVNKNVYVGHRYVPKIMGEHDKTQSYEGLSIVTNEGNSYTSKKHVPIGVDISNTEYWVVTGNYNVQIENYRNEVDRLSNNVNENINDFKNEVNEVNDEQTKNIRNISITPLMFGAKGDGITDDTQALQDAIDFAIENGLILHSHPDKEYLTSGNNIYQEDTKNEYDTVLTLTGTFRLKAKNNNQEYVLKINNTIDAQCELVIEGERKVKYGILANTFRVSKFYRTCVRRCKLWGMTYEPKGNNNLVQQDYFEGRLNGTRHDVVLKKISATENVETGISGYGTYEIVGGLDSIYKEKNATYFLRYNDEAYKIDSFDGNNIRVINLNAGEIGELINVRIYSGGALNIPKHGDNGAGHLLTINVISNYGIGVNNSSLYSHNFVNFVAQGNGIGFSCDDFTIGASFISPYFEINNIDAVVWNYVRGTMTHGVFHPDRFQTLITRVSGNIKGINGIRYLTDNSGGLLSYRTPVFNPSQDSVITPGYINSFHKTSATDWSLMLDNNKIFDDYHTHSTIVNLGFTNKTGARELKIKLKENNGETIQGQEEYIHPFKITGNTTVILFKVNNDWKVNVLNENVYTNVGYAPTHIGQIAVTDGIAYISTGTETKDDWKKIQLQE